MTASSHSLWSDFLSRVEPRVSAHVFSTWLKPLVMVNFDQDSVTLAVRDQFARDWLVDHYASFIQNELQQTAGHAIAVDFVVDPQVNGQVANPEKLPEEESIVINPTELASSFFHPRYSFDHFVCGPSNQFAFAACKAVAENPAKSYNPLFIFGGVGLGKTHLLSAIGYHVHRIKPQFRIIYTSSERFVNEVINAVRFSKLPELHHKYRSSCDILLMDDIQLIAGKERTQHEFFHVFNTLHESLRQIVVTSDKLPHEIPDIEERLRSRFQWGLITDIQPPEIETRIAILRKKAETENLSLDDSVAFFLAKNIHSNVRELEGALVRLRAHASLTGNPLTVDYARDVLSDVLSNRGQPLSVDMIQKIVASYYQLKILDLKSSKRHKALIRPRQVAMYLCRKHAGASYPELGARFGNKDHTTILSACRKIDGSLKEDNSLRSQISDLERQLDIK